MRNLSLISIALLLIALGGCAPQVDIETEKAAIRELTDVEWMEAGKAKDIDRWISFHTDDALLVLPNAPLISGKEAIRALVSEMIAAPGWAARWETTEIEVSRSGDLAYSYGPQENTVHDAEGNPVISRLNWVGTWEKQVDGTWKCAVLIISPAAQSAPEAE